MAAGPVTRAHANPVSLTPISSKLYADELDNLVAAHNALYADWSLDVATLREVVTPSTSPAGTQNALTANGVLVGHSENTITGGGSTFPVMDSTAHLFNVNGVYVLKPGVVFQAVKTADPALWATYKTIGYDSELGTNVHYSVYILSNATSFVGDRTVRLPTIIQYPTPSFGFPVGSIITVANDTHSSTRNVIVQNHDGSPLFGGAGEMTLANRGSYVTVIALPTGWVYYADYAG